MQLIRQRNGIYHKYIIIIPKKIIKQINWKTGSPLEINIVDGKLTIGINKNE